MQNKMNQQYKSLIEMREERVDEDEDENVDA